MPTIITRGVASAKGFGFSGAKKVTQFYTSRSSSTTEGLTSDFQTTASNTESWGYATGNADCISITPTKDVYLFGVTIGNYFSVPNSFTFVLRVNLTSATNGTVVASKTYTNQALSTGTGQTMVTFDSPVLLSANTTYTVGFGWPAGFTNGRTFYASSLSRTISTVTINDQSFSCTYSTTTFNSADPFDASNGTTTNLGQCVTFLWGTTW